MKLALGSAQFGMHYGISNSSGMVSEEHIHQILECALLNDINLIDTAIDYGDSELRLGAHVDNKFRVVTKLPFCPEDTEDILEWALLQVEGSKKRLGVESLYGLLLHRPEQLLGNSGSKLWDAMTELKIQGHVKRIGISIYNPSELEAISPKFSLDLVQSPFNVFDTRLHSSGWLEKLHQNSTEIHVRSIFLQGLLLMSQHEIPKIFLPWKKSFQAWHDWLASNSLSPLAGCIRFIDIFNEIDQIIIGIETRDQLIEIINAGNTESPSSWPDLSVDNCALINPASWDSL
jgi:aryl-alcohol dehydrogenase-like predicted oxidoreductase